VGRYLGFSGARQLRARTASSGELPPSPQPRENNYPQGYNEQDNQHVIHSFSLSFLHVLSRSVADTNFPSAKLVPEQWRMVPFFCRDHSPS
jgi:hypothetical protein